MGLKKRRKEDITKISSLQLTHKKYKTVEEKFQYLPMLALGKEVLHRALENNQGFCIY